MKKLTLTEVARQLCDGLDKNITDVANRLRQYINNNPMTLEELNEKCWNDSNEIFNAIY